MPTTPHNDSQLNTPTRATTCNPPIRALHVHQTRTPRMQHPTTRVANVTSIDKTSTAPTEAKVGIALECTQIRSRGVAPAPANKSRHHGACA